MPMHRPIRRPPFTHTDADTTRHHHGAHPRHHGPGQHGPRHGATPPNRSHWTGKAPSGQDPSLTVIVGISNDPRFGPAERTGRGP